MATTCITKQLAEQLKVAVKAGKINIAKMYEMTSKERREMFEYYVDTETASFVNGKFEEAMISTDVNALKSWAKTTFNIKEKKRARYNDVLKKIDTLKELGVLDPEKSTAFLEDLVATELGATVTADEAKVISEKSAKLSAEAGKRTEFGTPTIEYLLARKEMNDYLESITPSSRLKVASSLIGRGSMLFSLKSPLLNIESNTVHGLIQAVERRLNTRKIGGNNNDYAMKYIAFVNKVYSKTGFDVSRMITLEAESKIRGEDITTAQGPGVVRAVGRFYEDFIFKKMQGAPDVAFSSIAFADRANIESTKIAQAQGLKGAEAQAKALEIFKDSTSIEPVTEEGKAVREAAMADAFYSTYTNKSKYSDFALGLRRLINAVTGDYRLGDQVMPWVKTPANVIGTGIDASGVLMPVKTADRMAKTIKALYNGDDLKTAIGENFDGFLRDIIRSGLGMTFAWLISNIFKPEDFIGEYPTTEKEKQLLLLKNANPNSVKIAGKWWSLDFMGPLGAPVVGMMYARKYGKDLPTTVWEYYKGVLKQAVKIPGFEDFYRTVKNISELAPGESSSLDDSMKAVANYGVSFIRSRVMPAIVSDIAKGTDTSERIASKEDLFSQVKSGIPGVRQTLPEKKDVFGETIKAEDIVSTLLAGTNRLRTSRDDAMTNELNRLSDVGQLPAITDVEKSSSRAKELKAQIGEEKFTQAKTKFGQALYKRIQQVMATNTYKNAIDEKKKSIIDNIKDKEFEKMLRGAGYKKPRK